MKLVVLDCDGTLVDSQNGICEAMTHAFTGFGLVAPTREATLAIVGLSLPEAFAVLAAEHDEGAARPDGAALQVGVPRDPPRSRAARAAVRRHRRGRRGVRRARRHRARHRHRQIAQGRRPAVRARGLGASLPHGADGRRSPLKAPSRHAASGHGGGGRHRRTDGDGRRHDLRHGNGARGRVRARWASAGAIIPSTSCTARARTVSSRRATASRPTSTRSLLDGRRPRERAGRQARRQKVPGREPLSRAVAEAVLQEGDGRRGSRTASRSCSTAGPVRTPKKLPLLVPTRALAEAIAEEWAAQAERIDPATMPLSKLAITTIDGVAAEYAGGGGRHRSFRRQRSALLPRRGARRARRPPGAGVGSDAALDRGGDGASDSSWPRA